MNPDMVPIVLFVVIGVTIIGFPIAKAWARAIDRRSPDTVPLDVRQRLERIEAAVDSIAIEVERISEGQRFTTKLLAGRAADDHASVAPADATSPRSHP